MVITQRHRSMKAQVQAVTVCVDGWLVCALCSPVVAKEMDVGPSVTAAGGQTENTTIVIKSLSMASFGSQISTAPTAIFAGIHLQDLSQFDCA
ncbi:hypothetical protein GCM10007385_39490 [Tateyamaria omphalii]|nr:hypothetical protein GCM10007385_39490 [Tateyamaria omphalii]